MAKAVFFDRDGIVNRAVVRGGRPYPPADDGEFAWLADVHETLNALKQRGYLLLVFTNQPDLARGVQSRATVDGFHARILRELPISKIYVCPHDDADACSCRKPLPGMIFQGQSDYALELKQCWVVGDRWRDIEAGQSAGCRTVFMNYDYNERQPAHYDHQIHKLTELLEIIE